jgi:hypothetical protein
MPCDFMRVLEKPVSSALRLIVASTVLCAPLAALASNVTTHPGFAGIYVARVAKTAPSMSVSLGKDGTATVTADPGTGSVTAFGHWASEGDQVKVTFNATEDQPAPTPMVFEVTHSKLQPVSWDHQAWGNVPPPTMTKGYKVKYLFWTTTMR